MARECTQPKRQRTQSVPQASSWRESQPRTQVVDPLPVQYVSDSDRVKTGGNATPLGNNRRNSNQNRGTPNSAQGQQQNSGGNGPYRPPHMRNESQAAQPQDQSGSQAGPRTPMPTETECWYCGQLGHIARECPVRAEHRAQGLFYRQDPNWQTPRRQ